MLWGKGWGMGEGDGQFLSGLLVPGDQTPMLVWVVVALFCLLRRQMRALGGASCGVSTSDCHPNWVKDDTEKEQDQSWERQR